MRLHAICETASRSCSGSHAAGSCVAYVAFTAMRMDLLFVPRRGTQRMHCVGLDREQTKASASRQAPGAVAAQEREERERVKEKGQGTCALETRGLTLETGKARHFQQLNAKQQRPRSTPRLQPQRHRDRSQLYSYKFEYPTHPRPGYTRSKLYKKSRLKTEYAGSEPRGVWLCTLPSGSGYRHKHTHTTVLPACHFALYLATLVC